MTEAPHIGQRIKELREQRGWSLSRLAEEATVGKGYLWSIEKGETKSRPSGQTLYRIAEALGVTMSDLLGRQLLSEPTSDRSPALLAFAEQEHLPDTDIEMLASVNFRGKQPSTAEDWAFVYRAIRASVQE